MDHLFSHYKKTGYLHHAHVIEGIPETVVPLLVEALREHLNIEAQGNPDVTVAYHDSFGIEEARTFKDVQTRAAFADGRKIFIVGADSFTIEAQNALLKTFEEPTIGTHFFIILPRAEMLIPTLRSRVLVISRNIAHKDDTAVLAQKFLDASLADRFAIVKKMAEKKAGETIDRELFRTLLDHIERIFYTRTAGKRDETTTHIFREIFQAKTYLADRGASPKMLLEHIAMVIPRY